MIGLILMGALLGAAVFALILVIAPPKDSPLTELAKLDIAYAGGVAGLDPDRDGVDGWAGRIGLWLARQLTRRGIAYTALRQDIALTGQRFEVVLARKIILGCAGLLGTLLLLVAAQQLIGASLPVGVPIVVAALVAAGCFLLPDGEARASASRRRVDFRRALGVYLDLVALEMAGSAAPAEALPTAARVGAGWPMALIRDTLYRATRAGRDPWEALAELGGRIGVGELRDLGQTIQLVAHDGARVRQTLTQRAATMRRRELADLAGQAGKRDQSMRLAQVLIGLGFVVFMGYPAMVNVINF